MDRQPEVAGITVGLSYWQDPEVRRGGSHGIGRAAVQQVRVHRDGERVQTLFSLAAQLPLEDRTAAPPAPASPAPAPSDCSLKMMQRRFVFPLVLLFSPCVHKLSSLLLPSVCTSLPYPLSPFPLSMHIYLCVCVYTHTHLDFL